jgi:hypothetical protein
MFENYLKTIEGVGVYPLISLLIFVSFFIVILVWMIKIDKDFLTRMSFLPLDPDAVSNKFDQGENNEK